MQLKVVDSLFTIVGLQDQGMNVAVRQKTEGRGYQALIDEDLHRCPVNQQPDRQAWVVRQRHLQSVGHHFMRSTVPESDFF